MSHQPQNELASMLTALYCVTTIQAEIHQLLQGRACTKALKLQNAIVTVNIRSRSSKSN